MPSSATATQRVPHDSQNLSLAEKNIDNFEAVVEK
jgi:hypothetical protein